MAATGSLAIGDTSAMRILVIGAGGVGSAFVPIALRRDFFERLIVADYDPSRAQAVAAKADDPRVVAAQVDASDREAIAALIRDHGATHVLNAVDPRFVMPIFDACLAAGANYLDMAMSLSKPHPDKPHELTGVKLGDEQFAKAPEWQARGQLALVGIGVEPGLSDVFARYAQDHLFESIDEAGVRDGANLTVDGYDFAPSFSIWTTIEECLNPPVIWDEERGWYTTPPFSEPEIFDFPEGIGPVECVNVEHEEVLLIPRWVRANRVTFKYGLGNEFIEVLKTLHKLGLDRTQKVKVGGVEISPRDVVAAVLPDPATLGEKMLILDEPTAGIDPILRRTVWDEIHRLREQGVTSIVTTQYVTEAEECNAVALISGGRLIAFGAPDELRREALGGDVVEVTMSGLFDASTLTRPEGVRGIRQTGPKTFELVVDDAATASAEAIQSMSESGGQVEAVREIRPTFEDVFAHLVERDRAAREPAGGEHAATPEGEAA